MLQDHQLIQINTFMGLYGIDRYDDSTPLYYTLDELNNITIGDELRTRDGFDVDSITLPIIQFAVYRIQGQAARLIVLYDDGSLWDLTTNTRILLIPEMLGFAYNFFNNRMFISPHNGEYGLPGQYVYVYGGTGVARKAAGVAPTAGFIATISNTDGHIEAGIHLFAWTFETSSGFTTAPSEEVFLDFDGTKAVDFSNIPIGPVGTVARRLMASRAIQEYNGNPLAYEMFFVAGGRIANNTVTVLNGIDFYDVDLQLSADYLYDQLESIPASVFIITYGTRLCYGGTNEDKNIVWASNPLEPESIHSSAGFITYDPFETEGVKDGTEFRDNLYVCKRDKTYTIRDNGAEPSTWGHPITLDSAIGCDVNGIARYYNSTGSRVEYFTVTSPSGFFKFNGIYEEIPLSRNIRTWWDRLDMKLLNKFVTLIDQNKMLVYILVAIDTTNNTNAILVGNFENGFTPDKIKWHIWSFNPFVPSCIGIDRDDNKKTILKVSSHLGNIYVQEKNRRDDVNEVIPCFTHFALANIKPHAIHHVGALSFRMMGKGIMKMTLFGQDKVDNQILPGINLNCSPGKEFTSLAHFQSEKASLRVSNHNVGDYYLIRQVNMYINVIFETRPLV